MGYFTKPDDPPHSTNAPLSRARVEAYQELRGWSYGVDDDGDVRALWDGNIFYFFVMGRSEEVLQVRGRWKHGLDPALKASVWEFINDYHRDRLWPKAYTVESDGELSVYTEMTVDLEHGVADDQLGQLISCGLFTALHFLEALGEHLGVVDETDDEDASESPAPEGGRAP